MQSRMKITELWEGWVLIGISILFSSLQLPCLGSGEMESMVESENFIATQQQTSSVSSATITTESTCVWKHPSLMDVLLSVNGTASENITSDNLTEAGSQRPKCDEIGGCNVPLHCFDFSQLNENTSVIPNPPHSVLVTPHQLESIVENATVQNCCAVVLFYAPWCTFSVQFARKFNALGRSFNSLPILAVDLAENEPYKYILAYLPLVAFYYRGKTLFKFSLESSFEDLRDAITNVTGFQPLEVNLTDPENAWPVPTQRDTSDLFFLTFSVWWVAFIVVVYGIKSQILRRRCLQYLRTRLSRRTRG